MRVVALLSRRYFRLSPIFLVSVMLSGCGDGSELPSVAPPPAQDALAKSRPGPEKPVGRRRQAVPQPPPSSLKAARP